MFVNGFSLTSSEINKHSLFFFSVAFTKNIFSQTVGKYSNSITLLSKRIAHRVSLFLTEDFAGTFNSQASKKGKSGSEKSSIPAAISVSLEKETKDNFGDCVFGEAYLNSSIIFNESRKILDEFAGSGAAVIFFIIFIAVIRRRKTPEEVLNVNIFNKFNKTKISA
jgi:hypothetical protein